MHTKLVISKTANVVLPRLAGYRFVASKRDHDGYVKNTFNSSEDIKDQDDFYFRGSALWEPNEQVSLLVRGSYWEQEGNGSADFNYFSPGSPAGGSSFGAAIPINVLNGSAPPDNQKLIDPNPYKFARDVDFILDAEQKTYSAQLDWDFDFAHVMLLAAYSEYENFHTNDIDMSSVDTGFEGQFDDLETTQIEIHFSDTGSGSFQWLVGAIYLEEESRDSFYIETNGVGVDGFAFNFANKRLRDVEAWAVFGQVTVPLMDDRLRLTGGIRFLDLQHYVGVLGN